jgi:hypothetical protein
MALRQELRSELERKESKWQIKKARNARTYRACAMYRMEKNTAEMPVVMREAKMWRLRVNPATRHVRSHFGSLNLVAAPNWSAKNPRLRRCPLVRWKENHK